MFSMIDVYSPFYCIASLITPTIITSAIYVTSTAVTLVWTQISDDDARGVVTGYNVQYGLRDEDLQIATIAGHVETHIFNGLTPASTYQFAIAVHNANGSGPYSDVVYVTTRDDSKCSVHSKSRFIDPIVMAMGVYLMILVL